MKNKMYTLNTLLAVVVGVALLVCVIVRAVAPMIILPELTIPNMVLLSLVALVADYYIAPGAKRCYICIPVFSFLTFGLLPFAACFVGALEALKLAVAGAVVFTVVTWIFSSMADRMATGPAAKAAPVISALGLYLAVQCFMGLIL